MSASPRSAQSRVGAGDGQGGLVFEEEEKERTADDMFIDC